MDVVLNGITWTDRPQKLRHSFLVCSRDAIDIDFSIDLYTQHYPDYWRCYNIAQRHGCDFFIVENEYGETLL